MPPGSDDSILNTYAEGILGKYTAEFAGAWSAFHTAHMTTLWQHHMSTCRVLGSSYAKGCTTQAQNSMCIESWLQLRCRWQFCWR